VESTSSVAGILSEFSAPVYEPRDLDVSDLFPLQLDLATEPAREVWTGTGTKGGKTIGYAAWLTALAGNSDGGNFWWVGPWSKSTDHGFEEVKKILRPWIEQKLAVVTLDPKTITLIPNAAKMWFRSGDIPDALYGPDVRGVVVDEATRCREQVFHAVMSVTTPTNAPTRWAFNLDRGRRHWAIRKFVQAKEQSTRRFRGGQHGRSPDGEFAYYHFKTEDNPTIPKESIEKRRRDLPERVFRALYLAEVQEDGAGVFRESDVKACSKIVRREAPVRGMTYVAGVDLAETQDWTVVFIMDRNRRVVAWARFHQVGWTKQIELAAALCKEYRAQAVVEDNGVGGPVVEFMRNAGMQVVPWTSNNKSKGEIVADGILEFEQRTIEIPTEEEFPWLTDELLMFEYAYSATGTLTFSAPEGYHDDCVIALLLALHGVKKGLGPWLSSTAGEGWGTKRRDLGRVY
jgi:hypothetical protein